MPGNTINSSVTVIPFVLVRIVRPRSSAGSVYLLRVNWCVVLLPERGESPEGSSGGAQ